MKSTRSYYWLLGISAVLLALIALVSSLSLQKNASGVVDESNLTLERSDEFKRMLVPVADISGSDILLDISENDTSHISGSIAVPYTRFLDNTTMKSAEEIAKILGDAGISRDDRVVVYGECMPCGGGPAPATFVYWLMKSMGHKNVRVLDGKVDDWKALGKPTTNETAVRPSVNYTYELNSDFSASFDYVKSGVPQIVDARTVHEFEAGGIPNAINIPYESVISDRRIKDEAELKKLFNTLSKDRPVVVYTSTGIKASVVWFSMKLMGYDAKLYSYENWILNQAVQGNASLKGNASS